jgi:hypothetical protein
VANTGRYESASRIIPSFRRAADPLQDSDPLRAILSPAAPERAEAAGKAPNLARPMLVSAVVFALAFAAATHPNLFDRPVTVFINRLAGHSDLFDRLVNVVYWYPTFTGAPLMALVWACWV